MPSDEKVEKACAAYWEHYRDSWRPSGILPAEYDVPFAELSEPVRELTAKAMRAALAAAEAGEQPVASWECFRDEAFFDMWCVRPKGERRFGHSFHVTTEEEAEGLVTLLSASPPSEASRDERAAIRKEAFEEAAAIGYRICAETRHVTLGDKVEAAIRARGET